MTTLADIATLVQNAISIPEPPQIIETRYPYTYSADFLRTHADIIPAKYLVERVEGMGLSRAEAASIKTHWAEDMGVNERDLATVFADGYLAEHGIAKPPHIS